ncbi:hypothetical protein QE152_g37046 [Popillia japonica]|uniref:CCHC-type domain-containing protein n=1 Tax=Popillia japonica TaxID=7064 RepID=A0AAW1IBN2_POPJA
MLGGHLEREDEKLNTKTVKAKLLLEEKRLKRDEELEIRSEELDSGNKALIMKNTNWKAKRNTEKYDRNKYGRAEASSKVIFCFSCGGKGHIAKFCRKANKKDENNEASGSVAADENEEVEENNDNGKEVDENNEEKRINYAEENEAEILNPGEGEEVEFRMSARERLKKIMTMERK